jgi:hypothetical protein
VCLDKAARNCRIFRRGLHRTYLLNTGERKGGPPPHTQSHRPNVQACQEIGRATESTTIISGCR